ncbi:MAG: TFIIB-type zinc ribbon-containing protein [Haloarculaceae archaeon]
MRIRGRRECRNCGTRWSYYQTGSVECPSCGSLQSVGVDEERTLHTATPASLDLTDARNRLESGESLREVAEVAAETCRKYVRGFGFIDAGELQPLGETYLAATELRHVAGWLGRAMTPDGEEELYFLSLLRGADRGDRPSTDEVPDSLRSARGLAYARAVSAYRSDLRAYLDQHPDPMVTDVLGPLDSHLKRVEALDGDVPVGESELLVRIARDVGTYLREDDESALLEARDRLDRLP